MNTNYRIARPIVQRPQPGTQLQQGRTYTGTFETQPPQWHTHDAPPQLSADQLALVRSGVQNVTPFTNPSDLTPDQLNQIQSFQTMQNITANGGQLSPAQLQSLQAYYQTQAFANSPYVSSSAVATTGTATDFFSSVPTWAWIAGGVALIFLLRGRK